MPRVAFISTRRTNVGDDFVREGIRAVLDSITPYQAYLIDKHSAESSCVSRFEEEDAPEAVADKIEDVDAVVQCGAPFYWNLGPAPGQKCSNAEWIGPLWRRRIARVHHRIPVLNLAAGSCQPCGEGAAKIAGDEECAGFIRLAHGYCRLTTVRDRVAEATLAQLNLDAVRLPCASLHAWRRHRQALAPQRRKVAVNFMPQVGHYQLTSTGIGRVWAETFRETVHLLEKNGADLLLIAHSEPELVAMRALLPGRDWFYSIDYRDYFAAYGQCRGGFLNRVHGGLLLAGSGSPSVIAGNDTRVLSIDEVGLSHFEPSELDPQSVVDHLCGEMESSATRDRLCGLECRTFDTMHGLVRDALLSEKRSSPAVAGYTERVEIDLAPPLYDSESGRLIIHWRTLSGETGLGQSGFELLYAPAVANVTGEEVFHIFCGAVLPAIALEHDVVRVRAGALPDAGPVDCWRDYFRRLAIPARLEFVGDSSFGSPGALGAYRFHLNGGGLKAPNDPRNLNARVFRIGRAGASSSLRTRDIAAGDGVILGDGWYPYEYFGGETFRWFDNDACFTLVADRAGSVSVDVTVEPGPGVGCAPFTLEVRDGAGRTVAQRTVRGRETLRFSLPVDSPPPATGTAPPESRGPRCFSEAVWKV